MGVPASRPSTAGLAALYVTAVTIGLASAWVAVRSGMSSGEAVGPWRLNTLAGSSDAGPYSRARVALGGLLALERSETMYYVATQDSAGRPLRSRCRYRVTGAPPAGRWWSVTAYAEDILLFPNEARRYSVNGRHARLDAQGRFVVQTGPQAPATGDPPWIATPGDRGLMLTLRVYHPAPALQADPTALAAPAVERQGDC